MKKLLAILVAVVFMFVLVAGAVNAVSGTDDKAKSASSIQKENSTAKCPAECKDKAACKDKTACKEKAGECAAHKAPAKCAPKEGACPGSCPAKSACEKK